MIHIVTDSTADIPPELVSELNITVVPCFIMFGAQGFVDGVTITREQFYARLAAERNAPLPTTAAPGSGTFEETFRGVAQPGDEVLSIHVAAALSTMCNAARLGGQGIPGVRVTVYDSRSTSMGLGWQAIAAARAARAGASLAHIINVLDGMQERVYVFAALDTLEFLRRSGRVGWAKAFIGQVLNIKPMIRLYQGTVDLVDRVRTRARSWARLGEMAAGLGKLESLAVMHTTAAPAAAALAESFRQLVPGTYIPIVEVTPTIGVHVGPNGVGLAAVARGK